MKQILKNIINTLSGSWYESTEKYYEKSFMYDEQILISKNYFFEAVWFNNIFLMNNINDHYINYLCNIIHL